jgi:AAA15 family ATPase/GTPase
VLIFAKIKLLSMIKEININNFKSIQSLHVELGRLNIFIGANGSGKSNILESIAFGSVALTDRLDNGYLEHKGARFDRLFFKSAFEGNKKNVSIEFKNEADFVKVEVKPPSAENITSGIFHIHKSSSKDKKASYSTNSLGGSSGISMEDVIKFINKQSIEGLVETFNLKNFLIFAPENSVLRNFREEGQILPLSVRGEGLFNHLVELFKENPTILTGINEHLQLLDWFEGFEIPNDLMFTERRIKIKDRYLEDSLHYFDQRSANEGFLYLLFYLTLLMSPYTPNFFAIDNIDNAMNPKLGRELTKTLALLSKAHDKQVILTTHNPAILDGLNLNDDDQRLFVIYRNAYGHTKATRIFKTNTPEGQRPLPLSEQFLRGYLGGLPDNFYPHNPSLKFFIDNELQTKIPV